MTTVLLTHVNQFTGPGTLNVLLRDNVHVVCHDARFAAPDAVTIFAKEYPGALALTAQTPEELHDELTERGLDIDAAIFNDVFPNTPCPVEEIELATFRESFEALLLFPLRLSQLLLPAMKRKRQGSIAFVTSARYLKPEPGFAVATSIRAGTTALALALAREAAPCNIQVNVLAPNYLYSEAYYPRARFIDDPDGRKQIADTVPMGRLGDPMEVGELLAFMVSGRAPFMTGQVINFTGGWP